MLFNSLHFYDLFFCLLFYEVTILLTSNCHLSPVDRFFFLLLIIAFLFSFLYKFIRYNKYLNVFFLFFFHHLFRMHRRKKSSYSFLFSFFLRCTLYTNLFLLFFSLVSVYTTLKHRGYHLQDE
jgi:hypothetical protein